MTKIKKITREEFVYMWLSASVEIYGSIENVMEEINKKLDKKNRGMRRCFIFLASRWEGIDGVIEFLIENNLRFIDDYTMNDLFDCCDYMLKDIDKLKKGYETYLKILKEKKQIEKIEEVIEEIKKEIEMHQNFSEKKVDRVIEKMKEETKRRLGG
jgi:predicted deacetylase